MINLRKTFAIAVAAATLGFGALETSPASAYGFWHGRHGHFGSFVSYHDHWRHPYGFGFGWRPHRVCAAWEVFGGESHCVRWRFW